MLHWNGRGGPGLHKAHEADVIAGCPTCIEHPVFMTDFNITESPIYTSVRVAHKGNVHAYLRLVEETRFAGRIPRPSLMRKTRPL